MKNIIILLSLLLTTSLFAGQVFYVTEGGAGNKDGTSWANAFADVQSAIDAASSVATTDSPSEVWIAKGTYKHGSAMTMKNNVAICGGFAGTETSKEERVSGNNTILDGEDKYRVFYNKYSSSNKLTNSAKLDNVTIQNGYTSGDGAGMYNKYASPEITNCTFSGNSAEDDGGGMSNWESSSPELTNCTFSGNSASYSGGGMNNYNSSSPVLTNCTFSGNSANLGGGMYNLSTSPVLTNCTFSGNSASYGGGMYNTSSSSPTLTNCILWGNTANYGNEIYNDSSSSKPTIDTCIIEGGKSGITNSGYCTFTTEPITADPKLLLLGNYGGSVQTCPVGAGSSAIGAGKVVDGITTDARGFARSSTPTIGACEYQNKLTVASITTSEGYLKYSSSYEFTLNALSEGTNLTYQWYKDGVAIEGGTTSSYKTSQSAGTSKYTVVVSDGITTITSSEITIETISSVIYVSSTGSSENDGLSWATAKSDVQEAINLASNKVNSNYYGGIEVWIAKGTYKHGSQMTMKNNVAIYGGFAGTETSKGQRVAGNNTILDGEGKYRVFYNNYSSSNPLTNSAKLDNVTIQNGYISGKGAGMYNYYASPTIMNCTFSNNATASGSYYGGGIYNYYSTPMLKDCTFTDNKAYKGGANYNEGSSNAKFINCTFYKNKSVSYSVSGWVPPGMGSGSFAGETYSGCGGAIYTNSKLDIVNCTFMANTCPSGYQSIYSSASCNIVNSIISDGYSKNSVFQNTITDISNISVLADNGGNVQTCAVGVGSSAIGAGIVTEDTPTTDARGVVRSTTAPTIGAYECAGPTIECSTQFFGTINQDVSIFISAKSVVGDDNVSYQWQRLDSNDEWVDIEGATQSTYTIGNCQAEMNGNKYRCVVANVVDGASTTSEEATLTVYPSVSQATLSTNRITIVDGGYGCLEVSSDAFEPTYKWYYSSDTGLTWVEIENSNSSVLEFPVSKSMNRYQYKCVVTDAGGTSVESDKAVLIVNTTAITISQDIADTTAFIGKETILSVSANSSSTLGYQWQVSTDNGATWVNIKDATSSSLTLTPEDYELSGNLYRCKIDNGGGFIYSSNSTITVFKNVEITSQPVDLIVWNTKNAEFAVSATGDGTVKYQWQTLVGEQWQNIENATSSILLLENVSTEMTGNKYRCVVSNEGTATLTSNEATLTVYKTLEITTQPKETYTFEGDPTTFSVAVDAQGEVTYQWQELIADAWTNIENETSATFEIPTMENAFAGRKFRVVITNGGDEFISDIAELKLATPIAITKQPTNIDVAYIGKTATFSVEVSGYGAEYQWYVSGNYGTDIGVEIVGATGNTLSIPVEDDLILENVYFCKITNAKATLTTDLVYVNEVQTLSAFQEWSMANGLGIDASPSAIPHNDGITNLEKFAFGLDASKAISYSANADFKHTSDATDATLEFPVSVDAEGVVNVKALKSVDLINWTETTATATGETSSDGKFKIYKVTAPVGEEGKVFLKLKVEEK